MQRRLVARIMLAQYETPQATRDTIALLQQSGFNEVMVMNCKGHSEPAHYTREQTLARAELMRPAMAAFRAAGFKVHINNLATIGMNLSPPAQHDFGIQPLIDPDGQVFPECFCPYDPAFLDYLDFLFGTWASLGPEEIWVDDDFRYKNKAAHCFCPLHLAKMAEVTGRPWQREELARELRRYPASVPAPLVEQWSRVQKNGLLGAARAIAAAVHRHNPDTPIGLMGIYTSVHHYGVAYLAEVLRIFNPRCTPRLRPEFTAYSDYNRIGWTNYWMRWACDRACPEGFVALPEFETWPGTQFNHSHRVLRMKYAWAAAHGFADAAESTMWHVDRFEPEFPAYQRHSRDIAGGITAVMADATLKPRGVSLELPQDRAATTGTPDVLAVDSYAVHLVARLGLPLWPDGGHATVLVGNAPLSPHAPLPTIARDGVLVDRAAFDALVASGQTAITGGVADAPLPYIPVEEVFADVPENGIIAGEAVSLEMVAAVRGILTGFTLPADGGFRPLSWFVDEHGERMAVASWVREWEGGRMAVLPYSFGEASAEAGIANWRRKSQIEQLLEWAARQPLPVRVGRAADLYSVYRESATGDRAVVALANFSLDQAEHFSLTVPLAAAWKGWRVRGLDAAGHWQEVPGAVGQGAHIDFTGKAVVESQSVRVFEITPSH